MSPRDFPRFDLTRLAGWALGIILIACMAAVAVAATIWTWRQLVG